MGEQQKREKEFKDWQDACANAMAQSNRRPPDFYIKAKIYDRDMKGGIFKVNDAPLEKGIAALVDFTEEKFQNGVTDNRRKATEKEKSEKTIPNILYIKNESKKRGEKVKKLVYNESGNMDALTTVAIGAIFIIILLSITVFMGSRLDAAIDLEGQETIYVENETFNSGTHGTWVQLNHLLIVSGSETVRNISTGMIFIKVGNYSMNYTEGKIATT